MFTDMGLGARQIYASAADVVDPRGPNLGSLVTGQPTSRTAELNQEAANKRQIDAAVMATGGGRVGQIGTGIATALPLAFVPGANTYTGAALIGGSMGALAPTTENESRLLNTGVGAGLGVVGQYGANKLGGWLANRRATMPLEEPSGLTVAQQEAATAGEKLGMKLTPGQSSGSVALQKVEAKLEAQPWTSGPIDALKARNAQAINAVAAKAIGEPGNTVDATVLGNASERLGQVFESVRNPETVIPVTPGQTKGVIDSLEQELTGLLPNNAALRDNGLVKNLETITATGQVNGEQLGQLSSKLGRAAYKQMSGASGDRDLGKALFQVKDHVDDLLQSTLSGPQLEAYTAARQQYRALMQLTSRVGTVNPSTGNVSGGALANYLQQTDRQGFLFGKNQSDLYNAARFAQAFKPVVGNSGTATRSSMSIKDWALSLPGSLMSRAYMSGIGGALAKGAVKAPGLIGEGVSYGIERSIPFAKVGLPGAAGLVPYLTE
jgi:hypothetical protein